LVKDGLICKFAHFLPGNVRIAWEVRSLSQSHPMPCGARHQRHDPGGALISHHRQSSVSPTQRATFLPGNERISSVEMQICA
jgi:hypothetical protein